jgi:aspartyl-tRNA(Asn)/glutamyl-tRNA(Gln) amidotransferase subunit A
MADLCDLNASELLAGYRSKKFSPSDAMASVLARVASWEPRLNALYAFDAEGARAEAAKSSARWARGAPAGALDGVPITIKENIATRGTPLPLGTAATTLAPAPDDAPPAARAREAGAIIFAKTTMPDYGMLSSGLSSFHPLTRNPWNLAMNPGGSSAGAAAAAAAGYGPLHIGTDIGGSVRLPAGWCGIYTLKPSAGRVPIDPPYVGRVAGPMTRTVGDTALLMSVLSKPDWRDPMSLPPADIPWLELDGLSLKGLRIGLMSEAGAGLDVLPEVRDAVRGAARAFEAQGAIVEPAAPVLTRAMLDGLDNFWRARAWDDLVRLSPETRAKVLPYIVEWAYRAVALSGIEVLRGFNRIVEMKKAAAAMFRPFDFVISPTCPVPTYPAELASPINDPARPFEHIGFTVVWNMTDHPAASINCGITATGLPIGLQIVGRRFDDLGVLRLSAAYERLQGVPRPWPRP